MKEMRLLFRINKYIYADSGLFEMNDLTLQNFTQGLFTTHVD